jgi:hypothetical protein
MGALPNVQSTCARVREKGRELLGKEYVCCWGGGEEIDSSTLIASDSDIWINFERDLIWQSVVCTKWKPICVNKEATSRFLHPSVALHSRSVSSYSSIFL